MTSAQVSDHGKVSDDSDEPIAVHVGAYVTSAPESAPDLLERARLVMLDTVGAMVGATRTEPGARILAFSRRRGAPGLSTTVGLNEPRRAEDSALANGTLAHMLEFDDGHRPSDNHLGCVIVPSALVVSEETDSTLRQCLDAIVIGYDVMGRAGEATLLPRNESPFHGTGTTGVFGSAAVAARLLGLDAQAAAQALAIAGTAAAGLRESMNTGPDCKPLHAGRAAQNGITAAFLAQLGYTGPLTIFEGRHGFCRAMVSRPRPQLMQDGLGERHSLLEAGFKVHSTCGILFTAIDGVVECRAKYRLAGRTPNVIQIGVPSLIANDPVFRRTRPATVGEARFSIPYTVAAAFVDGEVSSRQMTPERLRDATIAALETHVQIAVDPEVEKIFDSTKDDAFFYYPASIELEVDGHSYRNVVTNPRGYDPTLPLTREQVISKFRSTVSNCMNDQVAAELVERIVHGSLDERMRSVTRPLQGSTW